MIKFLCSLWLFCLSSIGFAADFIEGKDYEILKNPNKVDNDTTTINVTEFFSFGCPWCYRIEPALQTWIKEHSQTIYFRRVPVIFNKDWEFYAKAYYTAKALSLSSKLDPMLFKAINTDKRPLNSDKLMVDFFIEQGVNPVTVKSAFGYSPSIDLSVKTSLSLMAEHHINAVPAFIVNNKFKTDLQMAKSQERLFEILNYLLTQSKLHENNNQS